MGQSVSSWFLAQPNNVFDVMKYSEMMSNIFGINVYQFDGHPVKRNVKLSTVKLIYFIVLNLLLVVVAVIHYTIPYDMVNNGSIIVTHGIRTLLVGGVLATSCELLLLAWNWRSIVRLLQQIHDLDLKLMKHPIDYATHRKYILTHFGMCLVLHLSLLFTYNISTVLCVEDAIVWSRMVFAQLYFNVVYVTIVFRYYCFVFFLSCRFEHLNDVLKLRFDTSNGERDGRWLNETKYRNGPVHERLRFVYKLSDLYHQQNEITDQLNGVFGDLLLGNLLLLMLLCTFHIFALIKVHASNDLRTRMFTVFNLCGSSYYAMMFMLISNMARRASKESKHTGVLIHKAMHNETNGETIRSLMVFSRQVRNRSAVIGSRQMIMDWPLIFQAVVVLVSYLVILLQFDASIRAK